MQLLKQKRETQALARKEKPLTEKLGSGKNTRDGLGLFIDYRCDDAKRIAELGQHCGINA
jgi:hypothetical protein